MTTRPVTGLSDVEREVLILALRRLVGHFNGELARAIQRDRPDLQRITKARLKLADDLLKRLNG